jgi:type VI secretion system secreted protein VgrG
VVVELLALSFECGDDSLSVRHFAVREGMSSLFEVSVRARSPNDDLDLGAFVGRPAALRVASGSAVAGAQVWSGVCSFMEEEQAEPTGLSSYHLRIAPTLWMLGHRRNHRIFQHRSVPEIVGALLAEWGIEPVWRLERGPYPHLEYRVQYGESDLAFVERLLEEAGISFFFADAPERRSALVLTDAPEAAEARGVVPCADHANPSEAHAYVTRVKLAEEVRHGKVTLRDFDFRRRPDYPLFGRAAAATEDRLEHYAYEPGAFVVEGGAGGDTPVADDKAVARAEEKAGEARAARHLAGERADRRSVAFETNVLGLGPGVVFSIARHSRSDLAPDRRLLVTERSLEGTQEGLHPASCRATFAAVPHRPRKKTAKPRIHGVQSAVVVGPPGEEIHTDEFGRVRVQFHWDRAGERDDNSSCWMRVSQGWAGGGYGMLMLPRVGHEVLVGFFEGDPDQPVVVGRVFNNTARVPYDLPAYKTRSTWKSDSSPGSDGFNEIMMEDAKGRELVYVQAERDLEKLVKHDETITVGRRRATTVGEVCESAVGVREVSHIEGSKTGREMVAGKITLTTGEATITLEGPNISMQAAANILLSAGANILANAGANVTIHGAANITVASGATAVVKAGGGDLVLQGGPMVKVNPGAGGGAENATRAVKFGNVAVVVPPDANPETSLEMVKQKMSYDPEHPTWFWDMTGPGGEWDYAKHGPQYEAFSALHYGLVGAAAGYPLGLLLRQAGRMRIEKDDSSSEWGDPGDGLSGGQAPFGNRAAYHRLIEIGYRSHDHIVAGAAPAEVQDRLEVRRLGDVSRWEVYKVARGVEPGVPRYTIAMRHNPEIGRIEYVLWKEATGEPVTGDVEAIQAGSTQEHIPAALHQYLATDAEQQLSRGLVP